MMPVIGSRFLLRGMLSLEWRRYLTHMLLSLGDKDSTNQHGDIYVTSLVFLLIGICFFVPGGSLH